MDNDSIYVEVNYTLEDIGSFQKSYLYKRISPIKMAIISLFCLGCAVMTFVLNYGTGYFPIGAVFFIMLPVIFLIAVPLSLKNSARKAFETNKLLKNTQTYHIDNNGIKITSPTGESNLSWDILYKAVETKDSFQFYLSKVQAHVIPKRCFEGNEEKFGLLREYMKHAPVPKEEKKGIFTLKKFGIGLLIYIALFVIILVILLLYSTK